MRLDDMLLPKGEAKNEGAIENTSENTKVDVSKPNEASSQASSEMTRLGPPSGPAGIPEAPYAASTSATQAPLGRASAPQASVSQANNLSFPTLRWHSATPTQIKGSLWEAMPTLNRFFSVAGSACLLLALARVVMPPLTESARQAYYPYTAAGKQELCATHLRSVAQALATYAQDYEGRYPPLDYHNSQGQRATWVSLVSGRTTQGDLSCPVGPSITSSSANLTSSFVLNPVVATSTVSELDDAGATLLLADGGTKHDVSLLPPYPGWPSYARRHPDGSADGVEANFDFRHEGQAGVVYADGHASVLSSGSGVTDAAPWGGSALLRRSRDRLSQSKPQAREFLKRLQADNVAGAASYLKANRASLKPVSHDLLALWQLNTSEQTSGEPTSDSVEKLGWKLAQAWQKAGDGSFKKQCDQEQTRRSQAALQSVNSGAWEQRQVGGQPTIRCEAPSAWTREDQQEGRYRRLYLRSKSPALYALLEVGNRTKYVNPQPINWDGEDKELRRRHRGNYHRLSRGLTTMNGLTASVWEYELEKPGLPRHRKRLAGYTDGWTSYVTSFSAPSKDWALWKPVFDRLSGSIATGFMGE